MIQLPRRSVTRFFIPLIDVLTLLFCIFLLMPVFKEGSPATKADAEASARALEAEKRARRDLEQQLQRRLRELTATEQRLKGFLDRQAELDKTREELDRLRRELARLRKEKIDTLQKRLAIRVLEIDADTGKLYYYDPSRPENPRVEIANQADARALIERQRKEARGLELYYLFLFPRRITGFPQDKQFKQYQRWFGGEAYGIDNPISGG
jgi:polyhydroxyalkanoate synthesis regulator phasin